jgi:hypothetical protein
MVEKKKSGKVYRVKVSYGVGDIKYLFLVNLASKDEAKIIAQDILEARAKDYIISSIEEFQAGELYDRAI